MRRALLLRQGYERLVRQMHPAREGKVFGRYLATALAAVFACLFLVQAYSSSATGGVVKLEREEGKLHVLVTGGAGFIGSHATLRLLSDGHSVTVVDNLSRGNLGAIHALQRHVPAAGQRLRFVKADLGVKAEVARVFATSSPRVDLVIHFAAIAFVGESVAEPLMYYHNITSNTVLLLEAMRDAGVQRLIYSSTCATYGNPAKLPITERTPPEPINPYGRSKLMAEQAVRDFAFANKGFQAAILRYFNVIGADPQGRLGELPRAELRSQGRISTACYDAALGLREELRITGTQFKTRDGSCVRDYVHVADLVDAHIAVVPALANPPVLYNVGTGQGVTVKEFVAACLKVTGQAIRVVEQAESRPGDYAEVYADVTKIQSELGWRAKHLDLEASLGHAWAWRQQHAETYE